MTPEEREKYYDEKIAPALLAMAEDCHSKGMSFLCGVEWRTQGEEEDSSRGRTAYFQKDASETMCSANSILKCGFLAFTRTVGPR
jgi:hypothetical protein